MLYVIVGDGEMPAKEVTHQLDDLWKKAEEANTDFWFVVEGKSAPNDTDRALVAFFNKFGIHYGVLVEPNVKVSDEYTDVAEYIDVDSIQNGAVGMMEMVLGEEDSALLALFVNVAEDDPADSLLIATITDAINEGFKVYGLNDSMEPVEVITEEVTPMPEGTVELKPTPLPTPEEMEGEEVPDPEELPPLDKEYLSGLTAAELKELCKGMGLTYPGTKSDAIIMILQHTEANERVDAIIGAEVVDKGITGTPISDEDDALEVDTPYTTQGIPPMGATLPDFGTETVTHAEVYDASIAPIVDAPWVPTVVEHDEEHALVVIHRKSGMQTIYAPVAKIDGWLREVAS